MCTVTYLPFGEKSFVLTSSRDVPYVREAALAPKEYVEDGVSLTYPKDGQAGGTWIGVSSKSRLLCLLNGGFKNHVPKNKYGLSRGLVVKNLLKEENIFQALKNVDLSEIEPFTLVVVDWSSDIELAEFVWTGEEGHLTNLPQKARIWSSTTLYDEDVIKLRKKWFNQWLEESSSYSQQSIIHFHKTAGEGNEKTNILMKRKRGGTVSVASFQKKEANSNLIYEDVLSGKVTLL